MTSTSALPLIRHSERVDFKRCQKKWYWHWRLGLFPKQQDFGALTLGTWVHAALAEWYANPRRSEVSLAAIFKRIADEALSMAVAVGTAEHVIAQAEEAAALGEAMLIAYEKKWGDDPTVRVIAAEIPLEFPITDYNGRVVATHKLKPDLVFEDTETGDVWLMEHKTAKQIRLEHLPIDDQARPYAAMAEVAMRRKGILKPHQRFKGVRYNFLRKALPDEREQDAQGRYLNKNGTVSKRQPTPVFVRHPIVLTSKAKKIALMRLGIETRLITEFASEVRAGRIDPMTIPKTPHSSCAKLCSYFAMCVVEEQGGDIGTMRRTMYHKENPYTYLEDTADIPISFELS